MKWLCPKIKFISPLLATLTSFVSMCRRNGVQKFAVFFCFVFPSCAVARPTKTPRQQKMPSGNGNRAMMKRERNQKKLAKMHCIEQRALRSHDTPPLSLSSPSHYLTSTALIYLDGLCLSHLSNALFLSFHFSHFLSLFHCIASTACIPYMYTWSSSLTSHQQPAVNRS